jgi:3-deoxy-D-manno-octulosonic-acid transferase
VTPLSLILYRAATGMLAPIAPALLRDRAARGKEDATRLGERLGYAGTPRPDGALAWLHGASVGESLSLLPLVEALRTARPELSVLVTSGTVTSAGLMAKRLPDGVIHQYAPIDTPGAARRFLKHWKPNLTLFVESEIWPNLILTAKAGASRLGLLSARFSHTSLKGWRRFPRAAAAIFSSFDLVMAQDDGTAAALVDLGASDDGRLNLKRLGAPPPVDVGQLAELKTMAKQAPVLLAASTHPGEDGIVLNAFRGMRPGPLMVIVPRHPARAADIERLALTTGFTVALRSRGDAFGAGQVYIADTLGELGLWFSLARVAFIGGSLLPGPGGHNPVEAAQLGCPIITGPNLHNWRDVYADLFDADAAATANDATSLAAAFDEALDAPASTDARALRARGVVAKDEDALNRAATALINLL